jgi:hypothetical protein
MEKKALKPGQMVNGFCTKYALSRGIVPCKVEVPEHGGNYVYARSAGLGATQMRVDKTFFTDKGKAEEAARKMASRKLRALAVEKTKLEQIVIMPKYDGTK